LQKKEIDMGHARALLSLDSPSQQIKIYKEIVKNAYSVRKVEEIVNSLKNGEEVSVGGKTVKSAPRLPKEFEVLKKRLADLMGTKVQMTCSSKGTGKITIPFGSEEELERLVMLFDKMK
jgi:ParB family chromosome partitioning protein